MEEKDTKRKKLMKKYMRMKRCWKVREWHNKIHKQAKLCTKHTQRTEKVEEIVKQLGINKLTIKSKINLYKLIRKYPRITNVLLLFFYVKTTLSISSWYVKPVETTLNMFSFSRFIEYFHVHKTISMFINFLHAHGTFSVFIELSPCLFNFLWQLKNKQ